MGEDIDRDMRMLTEVKWIMNLHIILEVHKEFIQILQNYFCGNGRMKF
jgi:hypothetical protein